MGKRVLRFSSLVVCMIISILSYEKTVKAEVILSDSAVHVICNIIYAVESGGQTYGNADYGDVTEAYTNSSQEHAITIGAGQYYGENAKKLLSKIRTKHPDLFERLDTAGVGEDLESADWGSYRISKDSEKAKCISKIISSEEGKKVQDELMYEEFISGYLDTANSLGIDDVKHAALYIQAAHLNPQALSTRYENIPESSRNYEGFYQWLIGGNPSNQNAVNGTTYTTRHQAAKEMIDEHEEELLSGESYGGAGSSSIAENGVNISEWDLTGMPSIKGLLDRGNKITLPSLSDLNNKETYSLSLIKGDIVSNNSYNLYDTVRLSVVFLGLLLLVYAMLMSVAFLFDMTNNLFEISLLSTITFGLLNYSPDETRKRGYVDSGKMLKILIISVVVGLFIVSGGVFSWLLRLIRWVSELV